MRWVTGFLLVVSIGLAGALVWFLTSHPSTRAGSATVGDVPEPRAADVPTRRRAASGSGEAAPVIRIDDEALHRLEAELASAPATSAKPDEERLAEAWAWVRANRPADRAYNHLEVRMLATFDAIFDGEEQSILWAMNASLIEIERVRALDADADGMVSDAEVEAYSIENMNVLSSLEHPYIRSKLDVDLDGALSQEELARLHDIAGMEGALSGVIERARIEMWDADLDGVLTDAEIEAGRETAMANMKYFEDGHVEVVADPSLIDPAEQQAVKESLAENLGPTALEMMEARKEAIVAQTLAAGLTEAMRLDDTDPDVMREQDTADSPRVPEQAEFDFDGDGRIEGAEREAFAAAAAEYERKVAEWSARQTAMALRTQFEHAAQQHDANRDGRLSDGEWGTRIDDLLAARRKRLFLRSYDTDASGRVDPVELTRFLDWHKAGSIRADANFDGVVNVLDLQAMMENYTGQ
ncbi:MAG: hypothetical protein DYG94_14190 [Leptolyngbya sp. PLA3]|nr:MAG: hypothetical protein EDM82_14835 [Cyanobacteria bacterium CYA]MCE7969878.1 hypothetical protein [Leptolyngbya sp. PL-A3]